LFGGTLGVDQYNRRRFPDFGLVQPLFLKRVTFRNAGVLRDLAANSVFSGVL
jgi:hypothetical protein